jgi:glycerol kinase
VFLLIKILRRLVEDDAWCLHHGRLAGPHTTTLDARHHTSTRCMVFDSAGAVVSSHQVEHRQLLLRAGWIEHDPQEIWAHTQKVTAAALEKADLTTAQIAACGITNQRETTVVWDRATGTPIHNAIVWQDTRTDRICAELGALGGGADRYRDRVGLPLATYFAGPKVRWILDRVDGARRRAELGELLFGTVDSWLLWNLTGGPEGGVHVTDVTNASRTLLMDLDRLAWDEDICAEMGIPPVMLPEIRPSSEIYGRVETPGALAGVPVASALGDQQAATFGQACYDVGTAKNTYGTGNFLLLNTGRERVRSEHGLLTHHCLLPNRRRRSGLRPGRLDRGHRVAGPVAAGQPGTDPIRAGC